jgi:hypothetical protein
MGPKPLLYWLKRQFLARSVKTEPVGSPPMRYFDHGWTVTPPKKPANQGVYGPSTGALNTPEVYPMDLFYVRPGCF